MVYILVHTQSEMKMTVKTDGRTRVSLLVSETLDKQRVPSVKLKDSLFM